MKKKLSFLLALVFVLTLAFGVLPGAPAAAATIGATYGSYQLIDEKSGDTTDAGVGAHTYTAAPYGTANIIAFKQGNAYVVWADSSVTDTDAQIITAVEQLGSSYINMDYYAVVREPIYIFNLYSVLHTKYPDAPTTGQNHLSDDSLAVDIEIITSNQTFTLSKGISHFSLLKYIPSSPTTGSLTVEKQLKTGSETSYNPNQEFEFKVKFTKSSQIISSGITYTSENSGVAIPQTDGSYLITLKIGETGTFANIPTNTWYEVTEQPLPTGWQDAQYVSEDTNGYGDENDDGKGKIVNAGAADTVTVTNEYIAPKYGSLTVEKIISSEQGETPYNQDQEFTIKVKFTKDRDTIISGIVYTGSDASDIATVSDGWYTVKLKIGEEGTFSSIPAGAKYEVQESSSILPNGWAYEQFEDADDDGTNNTLNDGKGKIEDSITDLVKVINKYTQYYGSLKVYKEVTTHGAPAIQFPIIVSFTLPSNITNSITAVSQLPPANTPTPVTLTPTVTGNVYSYTLNLPKDGFVIFDNIPVDTVYTVDETALPPGWTNTSINDYTYYPYSSENSNYKINHKDDCDKVVVKNAYCTPTFGQLVINKVVTGVTDPSDPVQIFTFNVQFANKDTILNGITFAGDGVVTNLTNGLYQVTLKGGQKETFLNIPNNTTYDVDEVTPLPTGWVNTLTEYDDPVDKEIETENANEVDTVTFTNTFTQNYGSLSVEKIVTNDDSTLSDIKFPITVVFNKNDATGSLSGIGIGDSDVTDIVNDYPITTATSKTYKLLLSDSDDVFTFSNIPVGFTYTVTEDLTGMTFWHSSNDYGNSGEVKAITTNTLDTVKVNNTYDPRSTLEVTKAVTGDSSADPNKVFNITIEFSNEAGGLGDIKPINATADNSTAGKYTMTLKAGETAKFENIPMFTSYLVSETVTGDFWSLASITPNDQEINNTTPIKVIVTNKYDPKGTLSIVKAVTGTGASMTEPFEVTVVFNGEVVSGIENSLGLEDTDGTYTFTMTAAQTAVNPVVFSNIPMGTGYTVIETKPTQPNWYYTSGNVTTEMEASFNGQNLTDDVVIYNHYTPPQNDFGTLAVTKQVTGPGADQAKEFKIDVVFTLDSAPSETTFMTSLVSSGISGPAGVTPVVSGSTHTYTIYLHHGETAEFSNIPYSATYSVTETELLTGYWSYVSGNVSEGSFSSDNKFDSVTIINNYNPPQIFTQYGSLTVDKIVSSSVPNTVASGTEPFTITVTFPAGVSGITNNAIPALTANNGVYTFTLTGDATPVTFSNIPFGTTYTVTETTPTQTGWTWNQAMSTNLSGPINAASVTATVANLFTPRVLGESTTSEDDGQAVAGDDDILPQTGGISSSTLLGIFGLALIGIGGTAFVIFRKKNTGKSK